MKKVIILAVAVAVAYFVVMAVAPVMAAEATAAIDIGSAYVWRGLTFNDGAVIQPSVDVVDKNGFGINVWGNYDLSDYDDTLDDGEFSEIDLTISYGFSMGKLDIGVGAIEYLFPATDADGDGDGENFPATTELYLSLGLPIVGGLSTALDIYYDIDALDSLSYASLSIAYAYDISDKLGLEAGASIGYAGEDFSQANGGDDSGLYDYTLSLSMGYQVTEAWSASAGITYVDALDDDNLKDVDDGGALDTTTYFNLGLAYAF